MSRCGKKLYDALGASPADDGKALTRAYRAKARETHPDAGGTDEAFALVARAYEVLSDPEERHRYDALGDDGFLSSDQVGTQARELLAHLFLEAVSKERGDMVALLRRMLGRQAEGLGAESRKLDCKMRELQAMTGRLVGGDLFDDVLRGRLMVMEAERGRVTVALEVISRARKMLEEYRDLQAERVGAPASWWDGTVVDGVLHAEDMAVATENKGGQDGR